MFCDGGPTKMLLFDFSLQKVKVQDNSLLEAKIQKCVTKIQRKINKTWKAIVVYPSFTKWAFKWSTFGIISSIVSHSLLPPSRVISQKYA